MDSLQAPTPASPVAATPTSTDAPNSGAGDGDALPWLAALQAAVAHTKTGKPAHAAVPETTDAKDAASDTDEKTLALADATAAATPCVPLALIATLPPAAPATTGTASTARGARDAGALNAMPGAGKADTRAPAESTPAEHHAAHAQVATTDVAASPDAVTRMLEHAAARESAGRDIAAQPLPFTLAHAATPAAAPPAAPPAAQLQINAALGTAEWGPELGQKVVWMIGTKEHVAELRVNPPDLGPLDIKLTVSDHQTTAVFTSPHGAVRDAVEAAIPRLREVLAESGIMLGNASVTSDTPRDGSAFAAPDGQAQRGGFRPRSEDAASGPAQPVAAHLVRRNGLVDLFA